MAEALPESSVEVSPAAVLARAETIKELRGHHYDIEVAIVTIEREQDAAVEALRLSAAWDGLDPETREGILSSMSPDAQAEYVYATTPD